MKYEKPQKGNPHQLTVKQHVFPTRSIKRFIATDGCVAVFDLTKQKILRLRPSASLFCATRTWDQGTEKLGKSIEDAFQKIAEKIVDGLTDAIPESDTQAITDFYALWTIRARLKRQPRQDTVLPDVLRSETNPTKDEQELLEKHGIGFFRPDRTQRLTLPARQGNGLMVRKMILNMRRRFPDLQWSIIRAGGGEFLVPDKFEPSIFPASSTKPLMIVPLSPTIHLAANASNTVVSGSALTAINQLAAAESREYYFARDLAQCPR
jgi:Protein of unknown function (DUF4238)